VPASLAPATPKPAPATPSASTPVPLGDASAGVPPVCAPHDRPVKLYWTEGCCTPALDEKAIACLSDAERAAVGYVSAELVSHCEWATLPEHTTPGHLDCPYTTALGFGYQCEEKHRSFLLRWLAEDLPPTCAIKPDTAYQQELLVKLEFSSIGARIKVNYEGVGTTGPGAKGWSWTETLVFERRGADRIKLVRRSAKGNRPRSF